MTLEDSVLYSVYYSVFDYVSYEYAVSDFVRDAVSNPVWEHISNSVWSSARYSVRDSVAFCVHKKINEQL
jgi:hypothetical protein